MCVPNLFQDLAPIYDSWRRKLHSDKGGDMYLDTKRSFDIGCPQAFLCSYASWLEPRSSHVPLERRNRDNREHGH